MSTERFERRAVAGPGSVAVLRSAVVAFAVTAGARDSACDAIALAVSEAVTNAVMHAYEGIPRGEVAVEAWPDGDGHLLVQVSDEGIGMRPRTDSPGLGVGLTLITQMADDLRIVDRRDTEGVVVSMRFALDGSGGPDGEDDVPSGSRGREVRR
jgi:serine/threonine-protein kinase RsbW/stage II sporulation protein AB (anti-sigma F factor)